MSEPDLRQRIEAAEAYERIFVPALFGAWAPRVAAAAGIAPGDRVLDVACGTGVLAREAARRVGAGGAVAGIDLNPGMLAVAERRAPGIAWRRGDAGALPYAEGSFDVVVSQFGLMFFADRASALREMARVLAPGGRLCVAVWDSLARIPAYAAELELVERLAGRDAGDALRSPFSLGDPAALETLAREAGLSGARIERHAGEARFPSLRAMVEVDLRGWLPAMGVTLDESTVAEVLAGAERALAPHVALAGDGAIRFDCPALLLSVSCPEPRPPQTERA